jgi:hypothetical protein
VDRRRLTKPSLAYGKKASQAQHSALTSSTILVTLALIEATDVPTILCNFTWSLYFRLRTHRRAKISWWPRLLQAFLADESKSNDDDDDSGSTVLHCISSLKCAFTEWSRKSCHPRSDPLTVLVTPQFGAHHLSVHCISECEWHHYSILLLQGPEIHDQVRSHYTVLHLITSNYSILTKLTNMYTLYQVKLLIIDEFSMTGQRQLSRISVHHDGIGNTGTFGGIGIYVRRLQLPPVQDDVVYKQPNVGIKRPKKMDFVCIHGLLRLPLYCWKNITNWQQGVHPVYKKVRLGQWDDTMVSTINTS